MTIPENALQPASLAQWRQWLAQHHTRPQGIWLITYKKATGRQIFTFDEAIEVALCFGWIDSKPAKLDADRSMLWFAPRQPGTGWSKLNKDRIARLITSGQMTEAGLAKIIAAKADGSWVLLDAIEALEIPADLAAEFANHPGSKENFENFPRSAKRGILEWIVQAKRPETRAKRVRETAELAAQNIRANQWKR